MWSLNVKTQGRTGFMSLRDDWGADNLPGTNRAMSQAELLEVAVRVEATRRISFGGDEIVFPDDLA